MAHSLTHAVASRVVATIAPRIDYPLNLMDSAGVIIASSDPQRVGAVHQDALTALAENRTIFTHHASASALPGVNVPLSLDGELVGVVGVTGTPQAVAPLAQLISLTVQLLLSAHQEHQRDARRSTVASETLSGLVAGTSSPQQLAAQLKRLGFTAPYHLSLLLDGTVPASAGQAVLTVNNALWVLGTRALQAPGARAIAGPARRDAAALLVDARNWRTLENYPSLIPSNAEFWDADLALAAARTPVDYARTLAERTVKLSEEHARTLLVLAASPSAAEAALKLNVHRNTLIQRLERIKLVTGADPRIPAELLMLLTGLYASVKLGEMHIF